MPRFKTAFFLFLILTPQLAMAASGDAGSRLRSALMDPEVISKARYSLSDYQYQKALFYYLTGDNLSLYSVASDLIKNYPREKERVNLLLKLSDMNHLYGKAAMLQAKVAEDDEPFIAKLLDLSYGMRRYDETLALSKLTGDKAVAGYFEGMSLMSLNRLKEASAALIPIPSDDDFYPYARIALAQIEVMKQNIPEAEKYLVELLVHPAIKKGILADKVHLLLGQLFFEKGFYSVAIEEFSKVSSSDFAMEARTGKAWSFIKLKSYEKAISLLKGQALTVPYTQAEWEVQIILGYCYLKTGKGSKAIDHYQELLNTFVTTEDRLEHMAKDEALKRRFLIILMDPDGIQLTDEEEHYLYVLQKDPVINLYLDKYRQLQAIKTAFLKKDKEAEKLEIGIENKIKIGETMLNDMQKLVARPKVVLQAANNIVEQRYKMPFFNVFLFSARIYSYWRQVLKKDPSPEVKWLVEMILQDFMEEEALQCMDIPVLCHLVSFLGDKKVKETPEQVREIVEILDILAKDMKSVSKGDRIRFEVIAARIREKSKPIVKANATLKELARVREEIKKNIQEIDKGSDKSLAEIERRVGERFMKSRYELSDFREGILAGLNLAVDVKQ